MDTVTLRCLRPFDRRKEVWFHHSLKMVIVTKMQELWRCCCQHYESLSEAELQKVLCTYRNKINYHTFQQIDASITGTLPAIVTSKLAKIENPVTYLLIVHKEVKDQFFPSSFNTRRPSDTFVCKSYFHQHSVITHPDLPKLNSEL